MATAEEIEWARIHAVGLRSWQLQSFYRAIDFMRSMDARYEGMAYIALKIRELRYPGAKIALWAHNNHIAMAGRFRSNPMERPGFATMGTFLKRSLGKRYEPIGFVAYEASIDWPGVGCGPLAPSHSISVEGRLRELGQDFLLVDLDFPGTDEPFLEPGETYFLSRTRMVPRDEFRALVYMETAGRMVPVLRSACPP